MRVALVAETFLPAVNGVVNSVLRSAEYLVQHGHDPVIVAPGRGNDDAALLPGGRSVPVRRVPGLPVPGYRGLAMARPGITLTPLFDELRPDVVHLASPFVLGLPAVTAARALGIPSVAVFQTDVAAFLRRYHVPAADHAWRRIRAIHDAADLTLSPSSACDVQLHRHGVQRIARWARGVDGVRFAPSRRSPALHRTLTGGRGGVLVGCVGRLAAEKRFELLADVARLPGVTLVVIGDGPRRERLARLLPEAVFAGHRSGLDLARHVASLDLLVHPGADETFCQVVQEALASGVPVVSAAAGGPLDLVQHGSNGWLWSGGDAGLLAAQVAWVLGDASGLRAAAGRARGSVVHRTWQAAGDQLLSYYREVGAGVTAAVPTVRALPVTGRRRNVRTVAARLPGGHHADQVS